MFGYLLPLVVDATFSWVRMFTALGLSILLGLGLGIWAATSRRAEKIIIPVVDILQTLPILAFFPVVIYIIVATIPGYVGINIAVIFLIITSMLWNIIFGVYEVIKKLPREFFELAALYGFGFWKKLSKIYVPASMPKVISQSTLSWAIGLFYLVTSEIFSTSNTTYTVKHGIGTALVQLAVSGNFDEYLAGIVIFVIFVILTRLFFFSPLERYFNRYNIQPPLKRGFFARLRPRLKIKIKLPRLRLNLAKGSTYPLEKEFEEIKKGPKYKRLIYISILFLCLVALIVDRQLFSYEVEVIVSFLASFLRVWFAFFVILVISIPLSVYLIFFSKRLSTYILIFQVIASIPATILLPVIVLMLSNLPFHEEAVAFFVYLLSGIWYVIFSILSQKAYISKEIFEVKELFGVKGLQAWKKIYIYAILPGLITGAVTGIAAEWNASIVAEYFTTSAIGSGSVITSVSAGIGKLLDVSLDTGNIELMLLALINMTAMIILINRFLWKRLYDKIESIYK